MRMYWGGLSPIFGLGLHSHIKRLVIITIRDIRVKRRILRLFSYIIVWDTRTLSHGGVIPLRLQN
ncbi:hypothetical protein H0H93_004541, partial [Arthromyces matolae]